MDWRDSPFAPPSEDAAGPARGPGSAPLFPIMEVDEIELGEEPVWLIHGLLPATGFGIVFGLPKSLKSFLLADALFHVAMGETWAGRAVMTGAVVYVTGEGQEGFRRRLVALRRHHGVEGSRVPFLLIPVAPDLGHASGDDQRLVQTIRDRLARLGNPPLRAVAVDTLARSMKGADENTAKDMSLFVDNCERIGTALGCIVIGVHHAGKDLARGSRGSNALDGAVDVMWSVEKGEGESTATIHHMKDGESGASWRFWLEDVVLREEDAPGGFAKAAVVKLLSEPGEAKPKPTVVKERWSGGLKLLRSAILNTLPDRGRDVRPYGGEGPQVRAVPLDAVRAEFGASYPADGETEAQRRDAKKKAFKRAVAGAQGKALIQARDISGEPHIWLTKADEDIT